MEKMHKEWNYTTNMIFHNNIVFLIFGSFSHYTVACRLNFTWPMYTFFCPLQAVEWPTKFSQSSNPFILQFSALSNAKVRCNHWILSCFLTPKAHSATDLFKPFPKSPWQDDLCNLNLICQTLLWLHKCITCYFHHMFPNWKEWNHYTKNVMQLW